VDVGGQCVRRATSGSGEIFSWLGRKSPFSCSEKKVMEQKCPRAPPFARHRVTKRNRLAC
jgi:hypothetical protein